ncbi:MAG: hypothetical protein IT371_27915 [Deltaproteobacteria bacterium]|nr:hypothetical protein [Deltaproteobacteria bacterium]
MFTALRWAFVAAVVMTLPQVARAERPSLGRAVREQVVQLAWQQHAQKQIATDNERVGDQILAKRFQRSWVQNVRVEPERKRDVYFDGHFSWTLGQGGAGQSVGPVAAKIENLGFLGNVAAVLRLRALPAVEMQPVIAQPYFVERDAHR